MLRASPAASESHTKGSETVEPEALPGVWMLTTVTTLTGWYKLIQKAIHILVPDLMLLIAGNLNTFGGHNVLDCIIKVDTRIVVSLHLQ
jgi:hypothetical protein